MTIGYTRGSTDERDLTAQQQQLELLGAQQIYTDHGLTGKNRARPALQQTLDAIKPGDPLLVIKLDRLSRWVPDARAIVDERAAKSAALSIGGTVHDPTDPTGRLLFNALAMVAEFERDLIAQRPREGMVIARQRGRLRGPSPKLPATRKRHLVEMFDAGKRTVGEIAEVFGVSRATVYRAVD
jgi:DNA invertase Pin-like site-specific DNA recombinase